jgi:hypothetical protein
MPAESGFREERAELEAVLPSALFARAPNIAQILRYICESHFGGRSHEIKEYNIAVEALGRPADFDQTRDSIVRVEARRLRQRLQEYYQQEGADHEIHINIPPGTYAPQFLRRRDRHDALVAGTSPRAAAGSASRDRGGELETAAKSAPATPAPLTPTAAKRGSLWRWLGPALLCFALAAAPLVWFRTRAPRPGLSAPATGASPGAQPVTSPEGEVRILAGCPTGRHDRHGNAWSADRYYVGGEAQSVSPRPIAYADDRTIYLHRRKGPFSYHIPLKKGIYELRLHFAETFFGENSAVGGGESSRVFGVRANGKDLLTRFDVIGDAGGSDTADVRVFKDIQPAADGLLHLEFLNNYRDMPFLNGLEVLPSSPGRILPIRIVARESGYTGQDNRVWSASRYSRGGTLIQRRDPIANTDDELLYQSERFGNFSYVIPVAPNSRYTATLKFCENWYGPGRPGGLGVGARVFDVFFNGRALLNGFDVFEEAGGLRALDKTFRGLRPNAQGKLVFSFVPTVDYPIVNAIEVLDEGSG